MKWHKILLGLAATLHMLKNAPKCKWAKTPSLASCSSSFRKELSTEGIQNNQGNWVRGIVCLHLCYMKKLKLLSSSQFICLKNKLLTSCSHTNVMKNKILSKDVATYEWGTAFWARAFVLIASTKGKNFLYTLFLPAPSCKFDPSSVMHMKDF